MSSTSVTLAVQTTHAKDVHSPDAPLTSVLVVVPGELIDGRGPVLEQLSSMCTDSCAPKGPDDQLNLNAAIIGTRVILERIGAGQLFAHEREIGDPMRFTRVVSLPLTLEFLDPSDPASLRIMGCSAPIALGGNACLEFLRVLSVILNASSRGQPLVSETWTCHSAEVEARLRDASISFSFFPRSSFLHPDQDPDWIISLLDPALHVKVGPGCATAGCEEEAAVHSPFSLCGGHASGWDNDRQVPGVVVELPEARVGLVFPRRGIPRCETCPECHVVYAVYDLAALTCSCAEAEEKDEVLSAPSPALRTATARVALTHLTASDTDLELAACVPTRQETIPEIVAQLERYFNEDAPVPSGFRPELLAPFRDHQDYLAGLHWCAMRDPPAVRVFHLPTLVLSPGPPSTPLAALHTDFATPSATTTATDAPLALTAEQLRAATLVEFLSPAATP